MADTLKCPKCGEDNPKTNRFCDSCGTKLAAVQATAPAPKEEAAKPDKAKKPKAVKQAAFAGEAAADEEIRSEVEGGFVINWEIMAYAAIVLVAILFRFSDLGTKPLHHDESMHAFYSWKLFKGDGYTYNPMMHGPFLFHANALVYFLFGTSDYTARVMPAIFGMICVVMMWWFKPYLGRAGAIFAALIIAISPGFVYHSRFIRNDIYIAGQTLMLVLGLFRYFDTKKTGWLVLAAVGYALAWATKEVNYITSLIFVLILGFRWLWEYSLKSSPDRMEKEGGFYRAMDYMFRTREGRAGLLTAFIAFFLVHAYLYYGKAGGSLWANLKYIWEGYVGGLVYWWGQHGVERGSQPWYFYVLLTPFYEMQSVFFMLIASVYYMWKAEKRTFFNIFLVCWWVLAMFLYSWAGEKMPWLILHPLLPMSLLAGKFMGDIVERTDWGWWRAAGIAVFILLGMGSIHGSMYVSFYGEGADPKESMVYVQSSPDVTRVSNKIKQFAFEMKGEKWASQEFREYDMYNLDIVCEDYCTWPFAWYLRDFNKIAYEPKNIPESRIGSPIILSGIEEANAGHDLRVKQMLEKDYVWTRYKLREWWAPDEKKWWQMKLGDKINWLWKRFMYRDVWNELGSYDMIVYVRRDLEKYWRSWEGK